MPSPIAQVEVLLNSGRADICVGKLSELDVSNITNV